MYCKLAINFDADHKRSSLIHIASFLRFIGVFSTGPWSADTEAGALATATSSPPASRHCLEIRNEEVNEEGGGHVDDAVAQEGAAGADQRLEVEIRLRVEEPENSGGEGDDGQAPGSESLGHQLGRNREPETPEPDVEDQEVQDQGHCCHPQRYRAVVIWKSWHDC